MPVKKINVLFISSWFQNRLKPTASKFVFRHAEAISLYCDIIVLHICFDKNKNGKRLDIIEETKRNIKIIYIYINKPILKLNKFPLYLIAYKKGFNLINKKIGKIDIVHANVIFPVGLIFLFLKSYRKIPFVLTEHWTGYLPENPEKIGFIKNLLIRKIILRSLAILPVSRNLYDAMIERKYSGKYQVVPNVVNTNLFTVRQKNYCPIKKILHISSLLDEQKNVYGILKVIKRLSLIRQDFSLHIVSNGNKNPLKKIAEDLAVINKQVFFHEGKRTHEIAEIMKQSDCLVLFSNYENLPCVVIEALSSGLPVISTDVGDVPKYITEKSGIIVPRSNEKELYNAINYMLDNFEKYDKIVMHGIAEKNFSYQIVGKSFYDIYSKIIYPIHNFT